MSGMLPSSNHHRVLSFFVGGLVLVLPLSAYAQIPLPPEPPRPSPVRALTLEQVESFGAVVSETEAEVAQTLLGHPELIPVAAAAADARDQRKHTGKVLTAMGFGTLGVGLVAAVLTAHSAPLICFDDEACRQQQQNASLSAQILAITGASIGLALAVPGFVKMAKDSDIELDAVRRYRAVKPEAMPPSPWDPTRRQAGNLMRPLASLSLLTFRF